MSTCTLTPARPMRSIGPIIPIRPIQLDLLLPTIAQRFAVWKATPGGAQVLRIAYALAARYAARHSRTGRIVSMKLIWEILRDNVAHIRARRLALRIPVENGFLLNNDFTAYVARHILEHRPEWQGLFETRELNRPRPRRRILIIEAPNDKLRHAGPETRNQQDGQTGVA